MRHQIRHRLAPHGDGEAFALLHSPQQARELGLGFKGADADIHGQNYQFYKQSIAEAVMTLSVTTFAGKQSQGGLRQRLLMDLAHG